MGIPSPPKAEISGRRGCLTPEAERRRVEFRSRQKCERTLPTLMIQIGKNPTERKNIVDSLILRVLIEHALKFLAHHLVNCLQACRQAGRDLRRVQALACERVPRTNRKPQQTAEIFSTRKQNP